MGNQMAEALVKAGLAEPLPEKKPRKGKQIVCRYCGKPMEKVAGTNFAVCRNCDKKASYVVFNR